MRTVHVLYYIPYKTLKTELVRYNSCGTCSFTAAPYLSVPTAQRYAYRYGTAVMELGTIKVSGADEAFVVDRRNTLFIGKRPKEIAETFVRLALDDIRESRSLVFIDPTGDLASEILARIPKTEQSRVLYVNPTVQPFALNPIGGVPEEQHPLLASLLTDTLLKDNITPYRETLFRTYFRYGVQTLLKLPGTDIFHLVKLLTDGRYRREKLRTVKDKVLTGFWRRYEELDEKQRVQNIESTLSLLDDLLLEPLVRNCLGQRRNKLVFKDKIVIVSLSESVLGSDGVALLGKLILSRLYLEGVRGFETTLYLHEAHRFGSVLNLILAGCTRIYSQLSVHYLDQFSRPAIPSVLGSVDQIVAFKISVRDYRTMEPEFDLAPAERKPFELHEDQAIVSINGRSHYVSSLHREYPLTEQDRRIIRRCASQCTQPLQTIEKRIEGAVR